MGNGYSLNNDGNGFLFIINLQNKVIVDSHVVAYNYNPKFIIAEQKPRERILRDVYNDPKIQFDQQEKIFNESPIRQFWIVNKLVDSVYGPYTSEEFLVKEKQLDVPLKFVLKLFPR